MITCLLLGAIPPRQTPEIVNKTKALPALPTPMTDVLQLTFLFVNLSPNQVNALPVLCDVHKPSCGIVTFKSKLEFYYGYLQ